MVNDHTNRFTWFYRCRECGRGESGLRVKAVAKNKLRDHWRANHSRITSPQGLVAQSKP